jgi:predicted GNAT family acetyltransferase
MGKLQHFMLGATSHGAVRAHVNLTDEGSGTNNSVTMFHKDGKVSHFTWTPDGGYIQHIEVPKALRRKGAATDMYELAKAAATEAGATVPVHSMHRTDDGDAWARKVGGELPERSRFLRG